MHELGLIQEMISLAEEELSRAGCVSKVTKITLKVGKLSGASPEALRFAFDVIAPSTRLAGAHLLIVEPQPTCHCPSCGLSTEIDELLFACPSCGNTDIEIHSGRDLYLESIDVEDNSSE